MSEVPLYMQGRSMLPGVPARSFRSSAPLFYLSVKSMEAVPTSKTFRV